MHLIATCPNCGAAILVQTVTCARCGRPVPAGEYVIAPAGSRYERKPICARCIDGDDRNLTGPKEVK